MPSRSAKRASKFSSAFRASLSADEVEQVCLAGVRASSETSLLDERIGGETADLPADSQTDRAEREAEISDALAGSTSDELERRSKMPGKGYPFRFDGKSLVYIGSATLAYEFCLAVSRAETITEGPHVKLPRYFERLCALAARLYLGEGAEGIRLGAPTDADDPPGHPSNFSGRAELLKSHAPKDSEEWELVPAKGFQIVVDNAKDYGMDFIAWKPFPDERIGRLTLLGQCACGRNDQESDDKARELDPELLKTLFRRLTWLPHLRLFATPYHVNEDYRFKGLHAMPNMVFDRARIAAVCEEHPKDAGLKAMRHSMKSLIEMVFKQMKAHPVVTPGNRVRRPNKP